MNKALKLRHAIKKMVKEHHGYIEHFAIITYGPTSTGITFDVCECDRCLRNFNQLSQIAVQFLPCQPKRLDS